jgi:hypothetical protein
MMPFKNHETKLVGRAVLCAPERGLTIDGAHGVTRPTGMASFQISAKLPGGSHAGSGWTGRSARVLRGASWDNNNADNLLSSYRNNNTPDNRNNNYGFRVVLVGGSAPRWQMLQKIGVMSGGHNACPARAKTSPNRFAHAPEEPGKIRGAGRGR